MGVGVMFGGLADLAFQVGDLGVELSDRVGQGHSDGGACVGFDPLDARGATVRWAWVCSALLLPLGLRLSRGRHDGPAATVHWEDPV